MGGARHALGGTFYQPTVLLDVDAGMRIAREETFGPVAPLFRFASEARAIALANDTEVGLAGYFYTRALAIRCTVARAQTRGHVSINRCLVTTELARLGGVNQPGGGRKGDREVR